MFLLLFGLFFPISIFVLLLVSLVIRPRISGSARANAGERNAYSGGANIGPRISGSTRANAGERNAYSGGANIRPRISGSARANAGERNAYSGGANAREYKVIGSSFQCYSGGANAGEYEVSESRMSALKDIMEALTDPNMYMMGVCGKDGSHMDALLERVIRRTRRANLFDEIVTVSIGKDENLRRIQEEIARELSFILQGQGQGKSTLRVFTNSNKKAVTENARQLSDLIRSKPIILFILRDLHSRLDLTKLGIPFGEDHKGCKLILTSQSEEILNHMNTQLTFPFVEPTFPFEEPSFINNSF